MKIVDLNRSACLTRVYDHISWDVSTTVNRRMHLSLSLYYQVWFHGLVIDRVYDKLKEIGNESN